MAVRVDKPPFFVVISDTEVFKEVLFMEEAKGRHFHYAWVIMFCGCAIVGVNLGDLSYTIGNFYLPLSLELGVGVGLSLIHI